MPRGTIPSYLRSANVPRVQLIANPGRSAFLPSHLGRVDEPTFVIPRDPWVETRTEVACPPSLVFVGSETEETLAGLSAPHPVVIMRLSVLRLSSWERKAQCNRRFPFETDRPFGDALRCATS